MDHPPLSLKVNDELFKLEAYARNLLSTCDESNGFNLEKAIRILRPILVSAIVSIWGLRVVSLDDSCVLAVDSLLGALPTLGQYSYRDTVRSRLITTGVQDFHEYMSRIPPTLPPSTNPPKQPAQSKESIADRLDRFKAEVNTTDETLAEDIGLSRSTYFDVKRGRGGKVSIAKVEAFLSHFVK